MKRFLLVLAIAIMLSLLLGSAVWAAEGDANQPAEDSSRGGEIALLLAPLLVAATAIERIIEMIFDWFESIILNLKSFANLGGEYLKKAQDEIEKRREAVNTLLGQPADQRDDGVLGQAEDALHDAEDRLVDFLESPFYTSRKRAISLVLGIILGPILALSTGLGMFDLLDIELAWWIDQVVTGLIIGTGSAPVHSLIGLLQKTRDAVDEARGLWSGKKAREVIEAEYSLVLAEIARRTAAQAAEAPPKPPDKPELEKLAEALRTAAEKAVSGERDEIDKVVETLSAAPSMTDVLKTLVGEEELAEAPTAPPALTADLLVGIEQMVPAARSDTQQRRLIRRMTT